MLNILRSNMKSVFIFPSCFTLIIYCSNHYCQSSTTQAQSSSNGKHRDSNSTNSNSTTDIFIGNYSIVLPAESKHTATIIFLHDYSQSGNDWGNDVRKIQQPYIKIVCPTANVIPISWYGGSETFSWFNILERKYPQKYEDSGGIDKSTDFIHSLIDHEIKQGIPPERIILAGASMGGAMALHSALKYNKKVAAVLLFSSWNPIPISLNFYVPTNKNIPIFMSHFVIDEFPQEGHISQANKKAITESVSYNVEYETYSSPHFTSDKELEDLDAFINTHLGE